METVNAARGADGVTQPFMSNGAINTAIYKLDVAPRDGAVCCRLTAANDAQHLMPPHLARFRAEAQHHGGAFDLEAELPPYDVEHTHEAWWAQDAPAPAASAYAKTAAEAATAAEDAAPRRETPSRTHIPQDDCARAHRPSIFFDQAPKGHARLYRRHHVKFARRGCG
eukprot:CAMPEP_0184273064 /NCGR_PEP_ID=MMETSP0977-20130417/42768_1 /TAXON_ID=483370 /ORGANISM="non described non described, Strain CCMP2097" /LENGTH=167 /DNA_ID=CAMNT_0026578925 /DNA_START=38 /DNA_END=539 /DNA_ORIENTATION=-